MPNAPGEIRTSRLLLVRPTEADRPGVVDLQSDPETHAYTPPSPTPGQIHTQFTEWLEHWSEHGFGHWMIFDVASLELVGLGGLQTKELDGERVLNLFYRFRPRSWGNGYASEMTSAALDWARQAVPARPIVIVTNVDNSPARRVADKAGFREYKVGDYRGAQAVYYRYG